MIEKVMDRYVEAYRRNDAEALAGLYAKEAMLLPPGHDLVKGRDSVRAFWSRGLEAGFEMATVEIRVSGTTAYVVGRYYVPADTEADAETGKYMIAFERDPDGIWRITADIWNADDTDEDADSTADSLGSSVATLDQVLATIAHNP